MITPDMVFAVPEDIDADADEKCTGCCFLNNTNLIPLSCLHEDKPAKDCVSRKIIYKLKREYKPHYRTPLANYRDSENDLS